MNLMEADVVVVSVQFLLTNKVFTELPTGADAETDFMSLMYKSGKLSFCLCKRCTFFHQVIVELYILFLHFIIKHP